MTIPIEQAHTSSNTASFSSTNMNMGHGSHTSSVMTEREGRSSTTSTTRTTDSPPSLQSPTLQQRQQPFYPSASCPNPNIATRLNNNVPHPNAPPSFTASTPSPSSATKSTTNRVFIVVGPEEQQAAIAFTTDMRDALLRGYKENGVHAFSHDFSNLEDAQEILEEMKILPPNMSSASSKKRKREEEIRRSYSDFIKNSGNNDGDDDEIILAQKQLEEARQKLIEAEQHFASVQQKLKQQRAMNTSTSSPPPSSMPQSSSASQPPLYSSQSQQPTMTDLSSVAAVPAKNNLKAKTAAMTSYAANVNTPTPATAPYAPAHLHHMNTSAAVAPPLTAAAAPAVPIHSQSQHHQSSFPAVKNDYPTAHPNHPNNGGNSGNTTAQRSLPISQQRGCRLSTLAAAANTTSTLPTTSNNKPNSNDTQSSTVSSNTSTTTNDNNNGSAPSSSNNNNNIPPIKKRPYNTASEQSLATTTVATARKGNRWMLMYDDLKKYKSVHGNCVVPRSYADNPRLASWVAEQRKQYRLLNNNKPSNITQERVNLLNEIGFTWQAQSAAWNRHLADLKAYKAENGDCMVPLNHEKYPQLGLWVKEQRRHRSLMLRGRHSHMTAERVSILESVGFCWDSHEAAWWDKYKELKDYYIEFGDCLVPHQYAPNPQLSTWVHQQKRQMRLLVEGKSSHMNERRAAALMELGFEYRHRKKRRKSNLVKVLAAAAAANHNLNEQQGSKMIQQQQQYVMADEEDDDGSSSGSDTESDGEESDSNESATETELRKSVVSSYIASDAFKVRQSLAEA